VDGGEFIGGYAGFDGEGIEEGYVFAFGQFFVHEAAAFGNP